MTARPRPSSIPFSWTRTLLAGAASLAVTGALIACGGGSEGDSRETAQTLPVGVGGGRPVTGLTLARLGSWQSGGGNGASEIPAYDPGTRRVFVVNGALGTVEVLDLSDPSAPTLVQTLATASFGPGLGGANSVAVKDGLVALAIEAQPKTRPGVVVLLDARTLALVSTVEVGALPDMLTFTPDGKFLLVANEGEPSAYNTGDAADDPEGSVSLIDVRKPSEPVVRSVDFRAFNARKAELQAAGVRLYGPGASVAQDLEPESIAVSPNGKTAWVTLQENNALAVIDLLSATVTDIKPLGWKDFSREGYGLDLSDEDAGTDTNSGTPRINIAPQPVRGLYLPDGIASYQVNGKTFLVTANEGDARADWPGFNEETRVREHCSAGGLDPAVFGPDAARLLRDSNLGRLRITNTPNGHDSGKNAAGQCQALYAFGGRSFSIWDAEGRQVYDSGDALERVTRDAAAALAADPASPYAFRFNTSHDNDSLDGRSPTKGPEPEGVVIGTFGGRSFAFVGLERVGGIAVFDISDPAAPVFANYLNTRNGLTGDRGPEGLALVKAEDSPTGEPLLIVGHEVSGTTVVYRIALRY